MTRKIWGRKSSSNVQAVVWCLQVLELDYHRIDAGITYGVVNSPEYLAINPNGTVPTIIDGSHPPLWESGAILRYLATRYGSDVFWPTDPVKRAAVDQWAEWSKINIALKFTAPVFWKVVRTAPSQQDPVAIATNLAALGKYLGIADEQLAKNQFLVGAELTLADIQFGHVLYRYFDIDIKRESYPNIQRYYDMLTARPDYQHSVMIDYSELRVLD